LKKKIFKHLIWLFITALGIWLIVYFEIKDLPIGSSFGGLVVGFTATHLWESIVDFTDNTNWKTSQRRLQRAHIIAKNTMIRISFAYLFRIKVDGKYFLVKNSRGTGKYQPVGGVYKLRDKEKQYVHQRFFAEDDNKIPVDQSSKGDYRLSFKNEFLRKFIRRFNKTQDRENILDLSREFKEELLETGILNERNFKQIEYTYEGRHVTDMKYSDHFQCYELLLADIVNLKLTPEQEKDFRELLKTSSDMYYFATDEEIRALGVKSGSDDLAEKIGDHTKKILFNEMEELLNVKQKGKKITCSI